jgi:hypothetical protein
MKQIFLIIFFSFSINAQELPEDIWALDIDKSILDALNNPPQETLDTLKNLYDENYPTSILKDRSLAKIPKKFLNPPKYLGVIEKGSYLYDKKNDKYYVTTKTVIAWGKEKFLGSDTVYLVNKDNKEIFRTHTIYIQPIKKDLELYPTPKKYKTYTEEKIRLTSDDGALLLSHNFLIEKEKLDTPYFEEVFGGTVGNSASASRFNFETYYPWDLPTQFGILLSYHEGVWENSLNSLKWQSFYFGPSIRIPILTYDVVDFRLNLSFQSAFKFNATNFSESYNFSANVLQFGGDMGIKTTFGKFVIVLNYRQYKTSLKEASVDIRSLPSRGSINSFSVGAGYSFDLEI